LAADLRVSMALWGPMLVPGFSSNHWAITQTLAGPLAAGRWTGLQNGIANLSGVIAPYVTGLIIVQTGNYYWAFASASIILLIGAFCYLFVVQEVASVKWPVQRDWPKIRFPSPRGK
jgi:sugar phosphate permease